MTYDLLRTPLTVLADEPSLDELLGAIRGVAAWTRDHAEALDDVLQQRILRLLTRQHTREELEALHDLLRRVVDPSHRAAIDALGDHFPDRWDSYARLVDGRIGALDARSPDILRRKHVTEVLEALVDAGGTMPQGALADVRGLKKANLTRVLHLMEAHDLIVRRRIGKENEVSLGAAAPRPAAPAAPANVIPARCGPRRLLAGATS